MSLTNTTAAAVGPLALEEIPLFAGIKPRRLRRLRPLFTAVKTQRTGPVMNEGALGREFVVLTSGRATVSKGGSTVADLSAGAAFGEVSLLDSAPRNASVVVEQGSDLLVANAAEFHTMLVEFPEVAERLQELADARS